MDFRERMSKLAGQVDELQARARDAAETAALVGMETKDGLSGRLSDARGSLVAAQENLRIASERAQGKTNAKLLQVQMTLEQAREDAQAAAAERGKEAEARAIAAELDYANECQLTAEVLTEEARVAMLEAARLAEAYREKYGEEPEVE